MAIFKVVRDKLFITALAVLLAVGVTGQASAKQPAGLAEKAEKAAEKAAQQGMLVAPGFLPVPILNISLIKQNRVRGAMVIELVLDIEKQNAMDAATKMMPRLNEGYASALAKWSNAFQGVYEPANVIAIKNQLQQVTNQVLGRDDALVLLKGPC